MYALCRWLFVTLLAWPVVLLWLGLTVRHRQRLPRQGPAILIANHNSHLDLLVLLTLLPLSRIPQVRPVAAADYFFRNRVLRFIAVWFLGLIPVVRGKTPRRDRSDPVTTNETLGESVDPLAGCRQALAKGEIIILFPEGTRGEPEVLSRLKPGLWHLLRRWACRPSNTPNNPSVCRSSFCRWPRRSLMVTTRNGMAPAIPKG